MAYRDPGNRRKVAWYDLTIVMMPRAMRHHSLFLLCAFLAFASCAVAQSNPKPPATSPAPPALDLIVPSAENTVILIRSTLLSVNDALRTGNYTVLRDLAAPSFRDRNTAGRLYQIFSNLASKGIDLSATATMVPKLARAPSIDAKKRLHISGHFPGQPAQLNFELMFEAVSGRWRLFGISVGEVQAMRELTPRTGAVPTDGKADAPERKAVRK